MPEFASLIEGYRRFKAGSYQAERDRWEQLAEGQQPPVMLIGCCDSRVEPPRIFDSSPGELFVLRNVANLVPPFETSPGLHGASAAIEYAVIHLKVRHIVVLGHRACGGVAAALSGGDKGVKGQSFIDDWIALLKPARDRVLERGSDDPQLALEHEGIRTSLANLRTFPFISEREQAGELKLHGAYFGIADGALFVLDEATGNFDKVD